MKKESLEKLIICVLLICFCGLLFYSLEYTTLYFVLENESLIDGEVFVNNISIGFTSKGKIIIEKSLIKNSIISFFPKIEKQYYLIDFSIYDGNVVNKLYLRVPEKKLGEGSVNLYFFDNTTKCTLNGEVFVDGVFIGNTTDGKILSYLSEFEGHKNVSISGYTDDCFSGDEGFYFYRTWEVSDVDKWFNSAGIYLSLSDYNPHQPTNNKEMQSFVRLKETKYLLDKIKFGNDDVDNLNEIVELIDFSYVEDKKVYGIDEYWQTPSETLKLKTGDCEDWAVLALSLIKNYDKNIKCYDVVWENHVNIFCGLENELIFYEFGSALMKKIYSLSKTNKNMDTISNFLNDFLKIYDVEKQNSKILFFFDEDEYYEMNDNNNFIEWVNNL